jgi:hypothetical protein
VNPRVRATLEATLFTLLAGNALVYAVSGERAEALDACGWLVLLVLYRQEARRATAALVKRASRVARAVAALLVVAAALIYWHEADWMDAINSLLWFAVVLLWELRMRGRGAHDTRTPAAVRYPLAAVSAALALMPLAWLARGEWFDAWDAALWFAAFALIEGELAHHAS